MRVQGTRRAPQQSGADRRKGQARYSRAHPNRGEGPRPRAAWRTSCAPIRATKNAAGRWRIGRAGNPIASPRQGKEKGRHRPTRPQGGFVVGRLHPFTSPIGKPAAPSENRAGRCYFQHIRHTMPALASDQRGEDAAARPGVRGGVRTRAKARSSGPPQQLEVRHRLGVRECPGWRGDEPPPVGPRRLLSPHSDPASSARTNI